MTFQADQYESFSVAYQVAVEVARSIEDIYKSGELNRQLLSIMAAAYLTTDCFASCIGTMGVDDTEYPDDESLSPSDYKAAADTMKDLAESFLNNLYCDTLPTMVDYEKTEWASALLTISDYLSAYLG